VAKSTVLGNVACASQCCCRRCLCIFLSCFLDRSLRLDRFCTINSKVV